MELDEQIARLRLTIRNCDFLLTDDYSVKTFAAYQKRYEEIKAHAQAEIDRLLQEQAQACTS